MKPFAAFVAVCTLLASPAMASIGIPYKLSQPCLGCNHPKDDPRYKKKPKSQ